MSPPQEIELHEAVLEYMANTADMSVITVKLIKIALEDHFGCDLDEYRNILKKSMHAFIDNLVGKDEDGEIAELRNTTFKKKRSTTSGYNSSQLFCAHHRDFLILRIITLIHFLLIVFMKDLKESYVLQTYLRSSRSLWASAYVPAQM